MARIYLETSLVSALVTDRTDVASLYRREVTCEWWATQLGLHGVYVSAEVLVELSHPLFAQREAAVEQIRNVPLLPITEEVRGFARILVREKVMPGPAIGDALHTALAVVHGMDYMLTWNVRHLANLNKRDHLRVVCVRAGYVPPQIVTPDVLWGVEQ